MFLASNAINREQKKNTLHYRTKKFPKLKTKTKKTLLYVNDSRKNTCSAFSRNFVVFLTDHNTSKWLSRIGFSTTKNILAVLFLFLAKADFHFFAKYFGACGGLCKTTKIPPPAASFKKLLNLSCETRENIG